MLLKSSHGIVAVDSIHLVGRFAVCRKQLSYAPILILKPGSEFYLLSLQRMPIRGVKHLFDIGHVLNWQRLADFAFDDMT
ncbi:MAG: hypothetical protein E5Y61_33100, partial [Mesorhizobium sp.]